MGNGVLAMSVALLAGATAGTAIADTVLAGLRPEAISAQSADGELYLTMTRLTRVEEAIGERITDKSILREEDIIIRNVQPTEDAGFTLQIEFERIYFEQTTEDHELIFDSQVPPNADPGMKWLESIYRPAVGISLDLTLDADGHIVSVDRFRVPNDPMLELNPDRIVEWVGLNAVRARFEPVFVPMPGDAGVGVGETRTLSRQTPVDTLTKLADVQETYTLKHVDDNEATIGIEGSVEYDFGLYDYTVSNAKINGSIQWNRELGIVQNRQWVLDMTYTGESRGRPLVITLKTTQSIERH